ncbi:uncharacterized protein HfgLR_21970 (plasmid) [Haloferax gibbonsii]|uniref:Uncharacterized protein n=1 Tax=Haloferax gibbonsii TaxID=35746 RepID=A0A871BLG6_HALGI|nr:uncharacterized protein HfgLR_21970 [Haloferax gibbonsii]
MVGVIGTIRYIANTYLSDAAGNFFQFGRRQWALLLVLTIGGSILIGASPFEALKTVGSVALRRSTALWGINSIRRIVMTGIIDLLIWEGITLLGCIVAGIRLYKNTEN